MASARSLLSQVRQIKKARTPKPSPIEALYDSVDAFAAEVQAKVGDGKLCPVDMPVVIECLRRWHRDGNFDIRHTSNGVWNRA